MQAAAPALGEDEEIARGLRLGQLPQALRRHARERDVPGLVSRDEQVHAHVGAALLELPRRVHVAGAYLQARHDAVLLGDGAADAPERSAAAFPVEG